ncbi:hypothetical protein J2Y48_002078 [Mycoplana sp. BE70]|nr:hypothetical protein [Mycoplana sp. BE70]
MTKVNAAAMETTAAELRFVFLDVRQSVHTA